MVGTSNPGSSVMAIDDFVQAWSCGAMAEVSGKNGGFVRAFGANDGQCVVNAI